MSVLFRVETLWLLFFLWVRRFRPWAFRKFHCFQLKRSEQSNFLNTSEMKKNQLLRNFGKKKYNNYLIWQRRGMSVGVLKILNFGNRVMTWSRGLRMKTFLWNCWFRPLPLLKIKNFLKIKNSHFESSDWRLILWIIGYDWNFLKYFRTKWFYSDPFFIFSDGIYPFVLIADISAIFFLLFFSIFSRMAFITQYW